MIEEEGKIKKMLVSPINGGPAWIGVEQLGLKLESIKAPEEVLVIDHIERPSAN